MTIPLLQEHALHSIRQRRLGGAPKILERFHQAADHRGGVATFNKGDKAHARVGEDRRKPVEFMVPPVLLVMELAPIKLHLLAWRRLVALHGILPHFGWA